MINPLSLTTLKVLNILNDCNIHTGSDIANALEISRAAVWKVIQRLKKQGVPIDSQHQGYQLKNPLILFDKNRIEKSLKNTNLTLEIFETISSTRDYLLNKYPSKKINICLTELQTEGKGRFGRKWSSPFGRNIYCSLRYPFHKDIIEFSGLSMVIGILTIQAIESLLPKPILRLKWPNDIYNKDQKIGGILIDLIAQAHGDCTAVISLGLNINMKDDELKDVHQPWTSLEHIVNEKLDRNVIITKIIHTILKGLENFQKNGMDTFLQEWKRYDYLENKKVSVGTATNFVSGIAKGVNSQGNLRIELANGIIQIFSYGDTILK